MIEIMRRGTSGEKSCIPVEYQQVEYLGFDIAGPYIDTGYMPSINNFYEITIDFQTNVQISSNYDFRPLLGFNVSYPRFISLVVYNDVDTKKLYTAISSGDISALKMHIAITPFDKYRWRVVYDPSNNNVTSTIEEKTSSGQLNTPNSVPNLNWVIFRGMGNNFNYHRQISYLSINENGTPIREFIPCYRKADNKPGMYDIVNNVFYTNAGTGEFTVGPDVN